MAAETYTFAQKLTRLLKILGKRIDSLENRAGGAMLPQKGMVPGNVLTAVGPHEIAWKEPTGGGGGGGDSPNLDGGQPDTIYGGSNPIDGGTP